MKMTMDDINYMQVVEQTHDEKVAMYMKCTKKQLIEMLIECHRLLDINGNRVYQNEEGYYTTTTGRYENTENDIETDG